jgi:hypothetical protein
MEAITRTALEVLAALEIGCRAHDDDDPLHEVFGDALEQLVGELDLGPNGMNLEDDPRWQAVLARADKLARLEGAPGVDFRARAAG